MTTMELTPKEQEKLMLLTLGMVAERRKRKGLRLNYPEAVAYILSEVLEAAREGRTLQEVQRIGAEALSSEDVMDGVAEMINLLQIEAIFTDGVRVVSIERPINR